MTTTTLAPALDDAALDLLFHEARSVHTFAEGAVDPAEITAAYETLRWAPTAMNISPLRLTVVPVGAPRERLARHMAEGNRAKTLAAPLTVVAATDPGFHTRLDTLAPTRTGLAERLETQPEQRAEMARTNGLLQVGYLLLALRARGLAVGPMGGFDADALDADLHAASGWRSLLVVNVGRAAAPDGTHPRAGRLSADDVVVTLG
ncbi:malonic semialdehyde reductase [Litorihabitans aurantiacus]|uniref:NADH dehydrogenase/NAD(P)H nitroreductase n=1 Tax=Litorihabitans aurantiacus TaxID=1930061 RepID=A0AA37XFA2_9MICO|nr:malonic semialdehyde reductase [Litorihabitans aurantiacus]GMA32252.1 putative NADH dehydrogenase/NAD(P)H nitroreductase [Litorihabitans aurantiacus]